MTKDFKRSAQVFKALCDENRLKILEILQEGGRCACKLLEALQITQPTLSHHMKILVDSGIVSSRREGKWTHYQIDEKGVSIAKKLLTESTKATTSK